MLRSLVGSEMCIRDRHTFDQSLFKLFADGLITLEQAIDNADSRTDLSVRCLLYTSDAADDLLCVDLGGRRIIKKNNNYS